MNILALLVSWIVFIYCMSFAVEAGWCTWLNVVVAGAVYSAVHLIKLKVIKFKKSS